MILVSAFPGKLQKYGALRRSVQGVLLGVRYLSGMHKDLGLLCGTTNIKRRKEKRKKAGWGEKEGKKEGRLKIASGSII